MIYRNYKGMLLAGLLGTVLGSSSLPTFAQDISELTAAFNGADFKQAISLGEDLVKRFPKNSEVRYYLARSYMKRGQLGQAEEQLRTAMSLGPNEEVLSNCTAALKEISQSNIRAGSAGLGAVNSAGGAAASVMPASTSSNYAAATAASSTSRANIVKTYGTARSTSGGVNNYYGRGASAKTSSPPATTKSQ